MHLCISELYRYIHAETINQELGFLGLLILFFTIHISIYRL